MSHKKTCSQCGVRFTAKDNRQKYCCKKCMIKTVNKRYQDKQVKTGLLPKTCPQCGIEFTPNIGAQKFCSKDCKQKHYKDNGVLGAGVHRPKHNPHSLDKAIQAARDANMSYGMYKARGIAPTADEIIQSFEGR